MTNQIRMEKYFFYSRGWCTRGGWALWAGCDGVQLCVQTGRQQTGASWTGLGHRPHGVPPEVHWGQTLTPPFVWLVHLNRWGVTVVSMCMSRPWCLISAVKCTCGTDTTSPAAVEPSLCSWLSRCGSELTTTATVESTHWIPRRVTPARSCESTPPAL